jgi:hypothetical protein
MLSACSISEPSAPNQTYYVDHQLTETIQNLIIRCALPLMYYTWSSSETLQVQWYTTDQAVYIESTMHEALQSCVRQQLAAQPIELSTSISGKIEIGGR